MARSGTCITIIPAYNEEETIMQVVTAAKRYTDVCVIDDCSSDFTPEILGCIEGIHVIHHQRNTHIPGCLRDGMQYAVENKYRYAIFMDAGLSHNPKEIPLFMKYPSTDLLIGCRTSKFYTPLFRQLLSGAGNFMYNICLDFPRSMFGQYYRDISSGFRRYSYKAMKLLLSKRIQSKSFDMMLESAHQIYKNGLSISEIPISYRFSNSSLNGRVIWNCIGMCFKLIFRIA